MIQFFGLPGSGKSYTAKQIKKKKNSYRIVTTNKVEEVFYSFLFFLSRPVLVFSLLLLIFKENKKNKRILVHKVRLFIKVSSLQLKSSFFKKPLIDDGFCQFVLSVFERKITEKDLSVVEKLIPQKTKIIIVESTKEKRITRIKKRKRIPRSFMGREYLNYIFPVWDYNYPIIKEYYLNNFDVKVIKN